MSKIIPFGQRIAAVLLVLLLVIVAGGCSRFMGPSDEEALYAIENSPVLKQGNIQLLSKIVILEKGKRYEDGSWPFKVKMTVTSTMQNGKAAPQIETTPTFRVYKQTDASGKAAWTASVGG